MIGRRNTLFYGLAGLVRIGETFERSYNAARKGHKIFYGRDPQYWKTTRFKYSWTKHSRHESRRKGSMDGRAPDTIARLKEKARRKKRTTVVPKEKAQKKSGPHFPEAQTIFATLPPGHILRQLLEILAKHVDQAALPGLKSDGCLRVSNCISHPKPSRVTGFHRFGLKTATNRRFCAELRYRFLDASKVDGDHWLCRWASVKTAAGRRPARPRALRAYYCNVLA
ncbi:hypothetical protein B0H13DRAFT_1898236 [Mycena leptocephala]|nr:hypothetical protein B0H13DRAFT_1898236 [Mycena leptocephala]